MKNKHISFIFLILSTFIFTLSTLTGIYAAASQCIQPVPVKDTLLVKGISDSILRLHVIADSDSDSDQEIKLVIKDALVAQMKEYLTTAATKEETVKILSLHFDELKETADNLLSSNGFSYTAEVTIEKHYFPIKRYGNIILPAGDYDALCVRLGQAEGMNWWCIVFPNLCFVDSTYAVIPEESLDELSVLLTKEEYDAIVTEKDITVTVRFKLFDWIKSLFRS